MNWAVNQDLNLASLLSMLRAVQSTFNNANPSKHVTVADLLVLSGGAAIEVAAARAGFNITGEQEHKVASLFVLTLE